MGIVQTTDIELDEHKQFLAEQGMEFIKFSPGSRYQGGHH